MVFDLYELVLASSVEMHEFDIGVLNGMLLPTKSW